MKLFFRCIVLIITLTFNLRANNEKSLFPQVSGWKLTLDDIVYDANNLWDAINGAAELFLEYNFVNLYIGTYLGNGEIEVKAEIYQHSSEKDAFGIYSQERDPKYNFINIGAQGYLQTGILNFLTGKYYIKLTTHQTGANSQKALQLIAQKIDKHLKQNNVLPTILQHFPLDGKQPNTEQYISKSFLGYSSLNNVFTANYFNKIKFKLFIIEAESNEKALATINKFIENLSPTDNKTVLDNKYIIESKLNGLIEMQILKNYIVGIINLQDNDLRDQYLLEFKNKLLR